MPKFTYYKEGSSTPQTGELSKQEVRMAAKEGLSLTAYMNKKYGSYNRQLGSITQQATNTSGIYLYDDPALGVKASTVDRALSNVVTTPLAAVFDGAASGTPIVAPTQNGADEQGLINRILFGENILQMVEETFRDKRDDTISAAMDRLVAVSQTFPDSVFIQPIINSQGAEDVEGLWAGSTQNTKPTSMLSIDLSTESKRIPSYSIGLELTYQAMTRVSLDMLSLIVGAHSRGLRIEMMYKDLGRILNGNPLLPSEAALPTFTATSLDATIANTAGLLTQKAWYEFLFDDTGVNTYDMILCDKDAYRSIMERTGRRLLPDPGYDANRFEPSDPSVINLANTNQPQLLVLPNGTYPAGTIVGIDTTMAIGEAVDSSANYQGTESDDITRVTAWRWDWSRLMYRLTAGHGNATPFKVMTLT
jgi:hypothetical protein